MMYQTDHRTLHESAALGTDTRYPFIARGRGGTFFLKVTAVAGTNPTLDVKIQRKDPVTGDWTDIPGASFTQKTGAVSDELTLYPGIAETGNETVSDVLNGEVAAYCDIGGTNTPTVTFTLSVSLNP